jgi:hypothetical protein
VPTMDAPTQELPISVRAYARRRGVSHTAVQRAIADGRLARSVAKGEGQPARILASIADVEWNERTSPAHSRAGPATRTSHQPLGAADDYRRSLVIEKVVRTKLAQVRLDEHQGRLIDAGEAGRVQFEIARLVRNQMFELPDRLAAELALESDAHRVREILTREITDLMRKLSARLREGDLTRDGGKDAGRANGH